MARKRELQGELERQRSQVSKTEKSLTDVESQLAHFNMPSPSASSNELDSLDLAAQR